MRTKESFKYSSRGPYLSVFTFESHPNQRNTSTSLSKETQAMQGEHYVEEELEEEWNGCVLLDNITFSTGFYETMENSMCNWRSVNQELEDVEISHLSTKQQGDNSTQPPEKEIIRKPTIDDYLFEFQLPRYNFKPVCYNFVGQTH